VNVELGRREREFKRLKVTKVGKVTWVIEVNIDETKCMVSYEVQSAGLSRNIEIGISSFESVGQFKYLGTSRTEENSIQEEMKSRLMSGNACYQSMQNILPSTFLSKNIKINNTKLKFCLFCMGVKHGRSH
jgi:hypothetical protein